MKKYNTKKNVFEASQERIALVFDNFENIYVSISSGKDSTVLYYLVLAEAIKRKRKINVFFLDQEAEYSSSIDIIRHQMNHPNVIPHWYQVPVFMTNATSYNEDMLFAWGEGQQWIRDKEPNSIHSIDGKYPMRFYGFFKWFEKRQPANSAFFIGLRADESFNRFRAVVFNPGWNDVSWSTKSANKASFRFNPIYDWDVMDVWKYINDNKVKYNRIYDLMYLRNKTFYAHFRVSNLIHEKSFKCLTDIQEYEPETYELLLKRVAGIANAARYADEKQVFSAKQLPSNFNSWKEYRDYLIGTVPEKYRERFINRYNSQQDNEKVHRQQVKQLLINDWENNIPVLKEEEGKTKAIKEYWESIL